MLIYHLTWSHWRSSLVMVMNLQVKMKQVSLDQLNTYLVLQEDCTSWCFYLRTSALVPPWGIQLLNPRRIKYRSRNIFSYLWGSRLRTPGSWYYVWKHFFSYGYSICNWLHEVESFLRSCSSLSNYGYLCVRKASVYMARIISFFCSFNFLTVDGGSSSWCLLRSELFYYAVTRIRVTNHNALKSSNCIWLFDLHYYLLSAALQKRCIGFSVCCFV
jgi:hypothetical protein